MIVRPGDTGAQDWRVWSQVSAEDDTPANLGALTVDADNTGNTFKVKVWNQVAGHAGAADCANQVTWSSCPP